ncbi:MAG: hypothetical protein RL168_891 [Bacteroidota bacterium]|jgi:FKBP-type peptidyl-prolyl cis-trans isomerase
MSHRSIHFALLAGLAFFWLFSCTPQAPEQDQAQLSAFEVRERMIEQNRAVLEAERHAILAFIDSSGMQFHGTGTGMFVAKMEAEAGSAIDTAQRVQVRSRITGLHGEVYADQLDQSISVLRDNDAIWGLQEALIQSKVGDSLVCVIPAHLAHGLAGDLAEIPPLTTLVYYLRILQ